MSHKNRTFAVIVRQGVGNPLRGEKARRKQCRGKFGLALRGFAVGIGEAQTLVAAAIYALHIIALGRWSTSDTAVGLATVQAGVIATICFVAALPGGLTLPHSTGQWTSMLYMALVAGAFALWAQTWAQAHLTATKAAIVMSLEPVMAAFFAFAGLKLLTTRL